MAPEAPDVTPDKTEWSWWVGADGYTLHVGITHSPGDGTFVPLLIAATIPPLPVPDMPNGLDQAEEFAVAIRDALAAGPWTEPDALRAWLIDKGFPSFPWPAPPPAVQGAPGHAAWCALPPDHADTCKPGAPGGES